MEKENEMIEAEVVNNESSLSMYLRELSKIPSINELHENEEEELGKMLKTEKREYAKQRLIEGNLRLVVKTAFKWKGKGLSIEDLIAEGNKALVNAAEKFDIDNGDSFATYAQWWIRVGMSRAIDDNHMVRIPNASALKKRKVQRFIDDFKAENGREPNRSEIMQGLHLSEVEMRNIERLDNACVSMNVKIDDGEGEGDEVGDLIANESVESIVDTLVKKEEVQALYKAIRKLDKVEQIVLALRYGLGNAKAHTLDEIAVKIGKTKERVRQIQKTAESKIHNMMQLF